MGLPSATHDDLLVFLAVGSLQKKRSFGRAAPWAVESM